MKKRMLACLLALLFVTVPLLSCAPRRESRTFFGIMNTDVMLTLYKGGTESRFDDCLALLRGAEDTLSRTLPSAELARLNADPRASVPLSPMLSELLSRALALAADTGGRFDPTAGILSDLFDIGGSTSLPPAAAAVEAALTHVDYRTLSLSDGVLTRGDTAARLDLGAIAKGYVASLLVSYLTEAGVSGGVLSLGGNVAVFGEKGDGTPFRIGVRDPASSGTVGTLSLTGTCYVSTSGAYERRRTGQDGRIYHHLFDPATGYPAESDLASVTVVDSDGARADAYSTALYVMGWEGALAFFRERGESFGMVLVSTDGEVYATPNLSFSPA